MRRLRICHLITKLELGGAQQNTLYTVSHLDPARFAPMLIAGRGGILDGEARRIPGLEVRLLESLVREVDPVRDARALYEITRLLREWKPDLVHTHSSKAGILGRWAAHLAGVGTIVHTVHGFGIPAGRHFAERWLFSRLEEATATITTLFLAVSRANLEVGVADGLFSAAKVRLVRSGVEIARFANGASGASVLRELGIPAGAPVAGMVACLKPQKAPLDWVRVAGTVSQTIPEAHFLLVGDGELRTEVEKEIERMDLAGRFHLLGWRRDLPEVYRSLSVLVLTSLWEGLPRVVPEAMAAGLPVVATGVDGTPEAVRDGENGYLAAPHDLETLADRVTRLLRDPELASEMGRRGRLRAGEFDIDAMVRQQEAIYEELASRND